MNDRTEDLRALFAHLKSKTKRHFLAQLTDHVEPDETFGYSTLTSALKGNWPTGRARSFIERAMDACARESQLDFDVPRTEAPRSSTWTPTSSRPLPPSLRGVWFLIQYRGKRESVADLVPAEDIRTSLVIYGPDDRLGRKFQLIGPTTIWHGHVTARDKQLYYFAEETSRPGIEEALSMVMLEPYSAADITDHHGINLSVAHGEHDNPHFPIIASRVLLWRVTTPIDKVSAAPSA